MRSSARRPPRSSSRDGLEQASRPDVADYHAQRFVAGAYGEVFDFGCGIGADAMALVRAGLEVVAVEVDPTAAAAAAYNLTGLAEVICADAETMIDQLAPGDAVFCDPARRTSSGRVWRVDDFRPSWPFVLRLLDRSRTALVKLGPALPHALIPDSVDAEWVSHRGDTVEVCLMASPRSSGRRSALIWPDHRLTVPADNPILDISRPLRYLYEPDGAVIRAGGIRRSANRLARPCSIARSPTSPVTNANQPRTRRPLRSTRPCPTTGACCAPGYVPTASASWRSRSAASMSIPPSCGGNCARLGRVRRRSFSLGPSTEREPSSPSAWPLALTTGEC